jgi:Kelch motif protein/galactose oxidase-like protein
MAFPTTLRRRVRHSASLVPALIFMISVAGIAAAQDADGTWGSPFDHPKSGRLNNAVYDPLHARMIVFGGSSQSFDVVWTFSLGDRSEWSPHRVRGVVPAHRLGVSAMFDPVRDRVIMFEGEELWSLSLAGDPTWTRLEAIGPSPPARAWHSAVYDSKRDRMIVFGGRSGEAVLGDVWTLDLANGPMWAQLAVPMPSMLPRVSHAATYDPVNDRMLVYGGDTWGYGYRNDTWELRFSGEPSWQKIFSTGPPMNVHATLIYDPVDDRAVLLGGWGSTGSRWGPMNDVWVLPAATGQWSQVFSLIYLRSDHAPAIYDAARRRIVVYNGEDAMMIPSLEMSGADLRFSWLLPRPWPRYGQAAIYDPKRERMVMTLGWTQDGPAEDTWELPLGGKPIWSWLPVGGAIDGDTPVAIHDPIRDRMMVIGGSVYGTWELPFADPTWNRILPGSVTPAPRGGHSAIHDARRDRVIVFGGLGAQTTNMTDAFSFPLDGPPVWSPLPPGPPRAFHNAIYDPVGDRMLVLGGVSNRWFGLSNEVWSLSLSEPMAWSQLAPIGEAPAARSESMAIYDPIRHRLVLHGGCCSEDEDGYPNTFRDTWELSLDGVPRWRRMTSAGPSIRAANLVYDPPRDRAILYGGMDAEDDFPRHDETSALTWGNPVLPGVSSQGDIETGNTLSLTYVVSNPLPGPRAIEWTVSSERDWPGFPIRGLQVVQGMSAGTVQLERTLPDGALDDPNELTFSAGYSGAPGHVASVRNVVQSREAGPASPPELRMRVLGPGAGLRLELRLPDAGPARLELLDVAGRRLVTRHVGSLGAGTHVLDLSEGVALGSGIYFVRLLRAGDEVRARAAVIR